MHFFKLTVLPFFILALLVGCYNEKYPEVDWKPQDGYVSTEASAIKIAEAVWLNVYGPKIEGDKPFKAQLIKGKVWVVEGTFNSDGFGGVPYIEIQKSDGKILKVIHGK